MAHLTNPLATPAQLYNRTSLSSLPPDLLEGVFIATQCLTQAAGLLLDLPQSVTARANVLLARFWLVISPMDYEFNDVSAAAVYLTAKVGPSPRSVRDVARVYSYLNSSESEMFPSTEKPEHDPSSYYFTESEYHAFQTELMHIEARFLPALSFNTHVALPHPLLVTYLQTLDFLGQPKENITRRAVRCLNTALLSPQLVYLTHQPQTLATAAIYSAARDMGAKMPACDWWEVFDVDREQLGFLVVAMRSVESCFRKRIEEFPELARAALTRRVVDTELAKRGLLEGGGRAQVDEEAAMMRKMDAQDV